MKCYAIANYAEGTDRAKFVERIEMLSRLSVEMIQLRAKSLDDRDLLDLARECRGRVSEPSLYIINGRADIAVAVDADGVHLPADGAPAEMVRAVGPDLIVGRSCHSLDEVEQAAEADLEFVVLGPVFDARSTTEKRGSISRSELERAARFDLEIYGLGGFDRNRVGELSGTGVAGVAGITLFMEDEPIDQIVRQVHQVSTL